MRGKKEKEETDAKVKEFIVLSATRGGQSKETKGHKGALIKQKELREQRKTNGNRWKHIETHTPNI